MESAEDLERMKLRFPKSLLLEKFVGDYLPFVNANIRLPIKGIEYFFKTHRIFEDNGAKYERVIDLEVKALTTTHPVYFNFNQDSHIGEDEDTGRDIWGISGYRTITISGEDFDELSEAEKQAIDIFKEVSQQFFKE